MSNGSASEMNVSFRSLCKMNECNDIDETNLGEEPEASNDLSANQAKFDTKYRHLLLTHNYHTSHTVTELCFQTVSYEVKNLSYLHFQ